MHQHHASLPFRASPAILSRSLPKRSATGPMSTKSPIEWTEFTWNPATGCTKISPAIAHAGIAGLTYLPDYIDRDEEQDLIHTIDAQPWITELKRRVQHYGYRYDYRARSITAASSLGPLPAWLASYGERLQQDGLFPRLADQIIINEYQPGQGIAPHIDCIPCFTEPIASLSLGSPCIMEFIQGQTREKIDVRLELRSLVLLSGDARYRWQHAIAPRKTDRQEGRLIARERRLSLTFRNVIR